MSTKYVRIKTMSPSELRAKIDAYFARIDGTPPVEVTKGKYTVLFKLPYTIEGLARELGITKQTLGKYLRGDCAFSGVEETRQGEMLQILTDARMRIEEHIQTRSLIGELENNVARQALAGLGGAKSIDDTDDSSSREVVITITGTNAQVQDWSR